MIPNTKGRKIYPYKYQGYRDKTIYNHKLRDKEIDNNSLQTPGILEYREQYTVTNSRYVGV